MYEYPLTIVRRQSPDWGSLDYSYFAETRKFEALVSLPAGYVENMIRLWDAQFGVSYFALRQALKEIGEDNLRAVSGGELLELETLQRESGAAAYLFIDDDDWFAPGIGRRVSRPARWLAPSCRSLIILREIIDVRTPQDAVR